MRTMTMGQWAKTVFLWIAVTLVAVISARMWNADQGRFQKEARFMMDTYVAISASGPHERVSRAIGAALDRMDEIAVKFNEMDPRSPVYAFNHDGTPITDPEILGLIRTGLQISESTGGAFDMTVESLSELWGFYTKAPHLPKEEEIRRVLKSVGHRHLLLKADRLEKDGKDVRIGLGGIAKGYAIREAIKVLTAQGVTSAMIDAGGDVYAVGRRGTRLWNIGIQNPRGDGIVGYVSVADLAVMGSGDYERFFMKDGKRYHHIFDPRTGYPTDGVASVTLIYPDPVAAQALGKIPFVLGPKQGLDMLARVPGLDVIIILTSGEKIFSKGISHSLRAVDGGIK